MKNTGKVSRRKVLKWVSPAVISISLPQHAHASVFGGNVYCGEIFGVTLFDLADLSMFFEINGASVLITAYDLNDFETFTATSILKNNTFVLDTGAYIFTGILSSDKSKIDIQIFHSASGNSVSFIANQGTNCARFEFPDLVCSTRPTHDLYGEVQVGALVLPLDTIHWSFDLVPTPSNNFDVELLLNCDGGGFQVHSVISVIAGNAVTFSANALTLGCMTSMEMQVQIKDHPETLSSCNAEVLISP